jgi:1,4-alpha-glucan branching enzyme
MSDKTKIKGMGAIPHAGGVAFRVWVPHHAQRVSVIGSFNDWGDDKSPMRAEENGYWYADAVAEPGPTDGFPFYAALSIGSYSVLIFSQ